MRTISIFLVFLVLGVISALADDQIPLDVLNKIKAATVFIKVKTESGRGSGSGFVIKVDRNNYLVITNEHVVVLEEKRNAKGKHANQTDIEVVFQSGSDREGSYKAQIVARDSVNDLAVLRLDRKGWGREEGLDYMANIKLAETLPVCILGFPFGKALSGSRRDNPAVTVGRGSISSIREDKQRGRIIQIDGGLNPGNSGGPVVDSKGRLIGVAVSKVSGTNIGFLVPASEISKLLEPRMPQMKVVIDRPANDVNPVHCELDLVDPVNRVKKLTLRYAPAEGREQARKSEKERTWPELADAQAAQFEIVQEKATTTFNVPKNGAVKYLVQLVATCTDNSIARSEPLIVTMEPSRTTTLLAKDRVRADSGRPITLVECIKPTKVALGNLKIESIKIEGLFSNSQLCWSIDGKSLYHIAQDGVVRKLSCPGLKEEASEPTYLKTGTWLSPSAIGLVVSGGGDSRKEPLARGEKLPSDRIIVLDYATLKPLRNIEDEYVYRAVSSPLSTYAYARASIGRSNNALAVYDLNSGSTVKKYPLSDFGVTEKTMRRILVSPDNKWLLTRDEQRFIRFKIDGTDVKLDAASPPVLWKDSHHELSMSYDGQWIEATFWHDEETRNRALYHDGTPNRTFDLFSVHSFNKPALTWNTFNSPGQAGAGFDRANGYVYAHTGNSGELQVFDVQGNMVALYDTKDIRGQGRTQKQMLVHPDGRYVAYLLNESNSKSQRIFLLELLPPTPDE